MTQQIRQSNLLSGEDWKKIYQSFSQVDFRAYDFDSIRAALVDYIRINYPEDFTDWTTNSEFIFIMDMLAYLGQTLAFRFDLNARDNFIDTAERRESILRLARMINYSPKRNYPARGLVKLTSISTDQDIYDSNGNNLKNVTIYWNDQNNEDWFEQFILIINSSLVSTNQFGEPVKVGNVGGIETYLYKINSISFNSVVNQFSSFVQGEQMNFEIVNPDFEDNGDFIERTPDPESSKYILYRNDGRGNDSADTGFFCYFKQGTLSFEDFQFDIPIENRIVDIAALNVNELDVWVQEINELGGVITEWKKVPAVENIAYNSLNRQIRDIYSVITNDLDRVSIKFSDGRIGTAPTGIFRFWYRTSNGLKYQVKPADIKDISVTIPYLRNTSVNESVEYNLSFTFALQYTITNSQPKETTEQIRQRSPQAFYSQNRMVTGEDYNTLPITISGGILKTKAVNRTYSGHSRYIDINDPTGSHNDTNIFADDGIFYQEYFSKQEEETLPSIKINSEIIESKVAPLLTAITLRNFFYDKYNFYTFPINVVYKVASTQLRSSTGRFWDGSSYVQLGDDAIVGLSNNAKYIYDDSVILFQYPDLTEKWVTVKSVIGDGTVLQSDNTGPVILSENVPNDSKILKIFPSFRQILSSTEKEAIKVEMDANQDFALRYNDETREWIVITSSNINKVGPFSLSNAGSNLGTNQDASWLLLAEYTAQKWIFTIRSLRYIFESENYVRFFFYNKNKVVNPTTGLINKDLIKILKYNTQTDNNSTIGIEYKLNIADPFVFDDGYVEPRRIQVIPEDSDDDGTPENPFIFQEFVKPTLLPKTNRLVFYKKYTTTDGYDYWSPLDPNAFFIENRIRVFESTSAFNAATGWELNEYSYVADQDAFFQVTQVSPLIQTNINSTGNLKYYYGRMNLAFQWKHYVPPEQRIDPAISNIMDIYVLTDEYNTRVQEWINSSVDDSFPEPPTSEDLRITFSQLNSIKMISDQIVWHPAQFKILFGKEASQELRATFQVVKISGQTITDNEIKQRVIAAVDEFFNIDNWTFGESFYYTELAAYIHKKLASYISSIVIVPVDTTAKFGNLFQIRSESNELFLSTATVADVQIISALTQANIKIGQ